MGKSQETGGGGYFLSFGRQEEWTSEMEEEEKVIRVVRGKRVGRGMKVEIVFWEIRKHH